MLHSCDVKPYELIAALMAREGIGALPLAKKIGRPELQPAIYRFSKGQVENPEPTTALPLASYFEIPMEAIYDERVATGVARGLGLIGQEPHMVEVITEDHVVGWAPSPIEPDLVVREPGCAFVVEAKLDPDDLADFRAAKAVMTEAEWAQIRARYETVRRHFGGGDQ